MPVWVENLLPISILLIVVVIVLGRLPKIELGHSLALKRRRTINWLVLGFTYAFLYMGRYNLTVSKNALGDLMTKADFGTIFFWGTFVYGCAFIINGPLTDRIGGRKAIIIAATGASAANAGLAVLTWAVMRGQITDRPLIVVLFSVVYAINMYFQSFGAVSIVKVNASWFHVRERGVFGGIFGILISLGIYFAFDWGRMIVDNAPLLEAGGTQRAVWWVFLVPSLILAVCAVLDLLIVRDAPSDAGFEDFDTADASSGDDGPRLPVVEVAKRMLQNPIILTIAAVEFMSGYLRNAIMHWAPIFAKETGQGEAFVFHNWGIMLCCAGILGGVVAGVISDRVFQSRRGPMAAILYAVLLMGGIVLIFSLTTPAVGWIVVFMSLAVIGVHGMLSGTASMDFGGRKNVGVAVGLIDGFVYLGTATQAILLGHLLPAGDAAKEPSGWTAWPLALLPPAVFGLLLATRVWNAKPQPKGKAASPAEKSTAAK